jgi:hypothetical protein
MIGELRDAFTALADDNSVRVVILAGAGPSFCAGADLHWMRDSLEWTSEQNAADAEALAAMFEAAWSLPKPLIGRIHGVALGGGAGLVACCDLAVAADTARLGFSEVKLGQVRVLVDGVLQQQPFVKLPIAKGAETGMLGLAVDPDYVRNHFVYAYHSDPDTNRNRVLRFEDRDGQAVGQTEILKTVAISEMGAAINSRMTGKRPSSTANSPWPH